MTPFDFANLELSHGVQEIPGPGHNARILAYLSTVDGVEEADETPWCSAFVNWCHEMAWVEGTGKANARSWMNWGVQADVAKPGDVVVFWRESPDSWKGHVGFYLGTSRVAGVTHIYCLGGNQGNSVSVRSYPFTRVLSYRRAT